MARLGVARLSMAQLSSTTHSPWSLQGPSPGTQGSATGASVDLGRACDLLSVHEQNAKAPLIYC